MASLEDLEDLEREREQDKKDAKDNKSSDADGDAKMVVDDDEKEDEIDPEILNGSTTDIVFRRRLLENDLRVMKQEFQRLTHEKSSTKEKIKDNLDKIENNRYVIPGPGPLGSCFITRPVLHRIFIEYGYWILA